MGGLLAPFALSSISPFLSSALFFCLHGTPHLYFGPFHYLSIQLSFCLPCGISLPTTNFLFYSLCWLESSLCRNFLPISSFHFPATFDLTAEATPE